MAKNTRIMMVAGEASGDALGAKLVRALREAAPDRDLEFFGSAGHAMRDAGVEPVVNADGLAIMGIPEIARAMRMFLKAFSELKREARRRRPDVAVLIDFPDFNLKLAKSLKRCGIRVVYYISPQLWAWRGYRRKTIRDHVDLLLTILPFEKEWYARHGIGNVEFVGNPHANEVRPTASREEFRAKHSIDANAGLIALLPGSRHKELARILPVLLETSGKMSEQDKSLHFVIPLAATRSEDEVKTAMRDAKGRGLTISDKIAIVKGETFNALNASDAAAVASGTATLETGMIGTPMAIVYRSSAFNYKLIRPLIQVDHFGLINLIAGKRIAAELIQDALDADSLSKELLRLLEPETNAEVRRELAEATKKLGEGGASKRAAAAIIRLVDEDHQK